MNLLVLLYDFFLLYWRSFKFQFLVSCIVSVLYFYLHETEMQIESITNVIGILFGFSISTLAILISNDNQNIRLSQSYIVKDNPRNNKTYTLYHKIVTGLAFTLVIQGMTLLTLLIIPEFIQDQCHRVLFTAIILGTCIFCIMMIIYIVIELFLIIGKSNA